MTHIIIFPDVVTLICDPCPWKVNECIADFRFATNQWETALLCNDVSHWLGTNLESALWMWSLSLSMSSKFEKHIMELGAEQPQAI